MTAIPTYIPPPGLRTPLDNFRDLVNRKYNLHLGEYVLVSLVSYVAAIICHSRLNLQTLLIDIRLQQLILIYTHSP